MFNLQAALILAESTARNITRDYDDVPDRDHGGAELAAVDADIATGKQVAEELQRHGAVLERTGSGKPGTSWQFRLPSGEHFSGYGNNWWQGTLADDKR